ncbi:MAG: glucose 1-dehydrogenase [Chloroflexi bacterium]|nr:glucose 1-dehydrogenase [Chloroflexota bacterium]
MTDQKLTDRVAIITGSDSGIGQATAIEFAREGADVVVTWHEDEEGARKTVRGVEDAGRRALLLHLDVTEEAEIESAFDDALAAFGNVDILMNNASIDATGNQIADIALDDWDRALRTNLTGPMLCARRFINERRKAGGGGKIINVTSVHDEIPRVGAAEYCASKGGLQNLTRTLALELAPDRINVNNIGPGMVLTPMNQEALDDPDTREEQVQSIPWKRAAKPEEIARLAVFLASADADYVSGTTYYMDGALMQNQGQGA